MDAPAVHHYSAACSWSGSTGAGYREYDRTHSGSAGPLEVALSSDPAFRGDAARPNPEQLVVLAASSCQLLSFLAVAARARLDVRDYRDDATATMPEDDVPIRLAEIVLRPRIVLAADPTTGAPSEERVRHLVEVAHRECFIANSLATPVRVEPTITFTA